MWLNDYLCVGNYLVDELEYFYYLESWSLDGFWYSNFLIFGECSYGVECILV